MSKKGVSFDPFVRAASPAVTVPTDAQSASELPPYAYAATWHSPEEYRAMLVAAKVIIRAVRRRDSLLLKHRTLSVAAAAAAAADDNNDNASESIIRGLEHLRSASVVKERRGRVEGCLRAVLDVQSRQRATKAKAKAALGMMMRTAKKQQRGDDEHDDENENEKAAALARASEICSKWSRDFARTTGTADAAVVARLSATTTTTRVVLRRPGAARETLREALRLCVVVPPPPPPPTGASSASTPPAQYSFERLFELRSDQEQRQRTSASATFGDALKQLR